jgi:hypothetical protein
MASGTLCSYCHHLAYALRQMSDEICNPATDMPSTFDPLKPPGRNNKPPDPRSSRSIGAARKDYYPHFPLLKSAADEGCSLCASLRSRLLHDFQQNPLRRKIVTVPSDDDEFVSKLFDTVSDEDTDEFFQQGFLDIAAPLITTWDLGKRLMETLVIIVGNKIETGVNGTESRSVVYEFQNVQGTHVVLE